jgi:hypothetical protein
MGIPITTTVEKLITDIKDTAPEVFVVFNKGLAMYRLKSFDEKWLDAKEGIIVIKVDPKLYPLLIHDDKAVIEKAAAIEKT